MQGIDKVNEIVFKELERLDSMELNHRDFDKEIERAKSIALNACQYVSGESLKMKYELAKNNMKVIDYEG